MNKYKAVIFDLDGTLLNTINDITDAVNYSLNLNGLIPVTVDEVKTYVGSGVEELWNKAISSNKVVVDGSLNLSPEEMKKLKENCISSYLYQYNICKTDKTKPYEGVVRTLNILKNRKIKLAVLSNKTHRDTLEVVNRYFPGIFDVIEGQKEGVEIKPSPNGVNRIINLFGLNKDEVLYVGDSVTDVKTFLNASVDGAAVCYGYSSQKDLIAAGAKVLLNSLREILKFFNGNYNGVLLVDKPLGLTSQDVVSMIRKSLKVDRVGHAGTLDPLATGLLVVLLGSATKISNYLLEEKKEYLAEITIGETTDTYDKEGSITSVKEVEEELDIDQLLSSLVGSLELTPPMHSAIKVQGQKLYDIARKGKTVDVLPRKYQIYALKRVGEVKYENGKAVFTFYCQVSKGTYIRSLCYVIGKHLGYPAYMTSLRRISSGNLNIKDAFSLDDILEGNFKTIDILDTIDKNNIFEVSKSLFPYITNGRYVRLPQQYSTKDILFMVYENKLIAVYEKTQERSFKARRVWK